MKTIHHPSRNRGAADHGWLKARHSFSFANFYNPNLMGFGTLRVLNDDHVEGGQGFGTHPHNDMEIITIPLEGDLEHRDSMGEHAVIRSGDVQVMSAGTGITHSEFNANSDRPVKLLQIWVFPHTRSVEPRYQQITLDRSQPGFQQILSPNPEDEGVWIHQDSWFHLGDFPQATTTRVTRKGQNTGLYVFVIEGEAQVGGHKLEKRDALGVTETDAIDLDISENSRVLVMEVPMERSKKA